MIYEYFRATGACEAVQGLAELVSMTLHNDDVQDFDDRWDHTQISVSEMHRQDCASQNYRIPLNFGLRRLRKIKILFDISDPKP